jgi:hypothetical protein
MGTCGFRHALTNAIGNATLPFVIPTEWITTQIRRGTAESIAKVGISVDGISSSLRIASADRILLLIVPNGQPVAVAIYV